MKLTQVVTAVAIFCVLSPAAIAKKKDNKVAEPEGYKFETIVANPITSVKSQSSTGTCWCFSSVSFFESEALRAGYNGNDLDLSEMFIVHKSYQDKAKKFVRLHGYLNYGEGSSFGNTLLMLKRYGIVPNSVMEGLNYGEPIHKHGELSSLLKAYVETVIKNRNGKLSTAWERGLVGILDAYLGECPESFTYNGRSYTPKSYLASLNLNLDDYVNLVSWDSEPYYEKTVQLVPDNWIWGEALNVPLDDFIAIMKNALKNGYTFAWAADISESGFGKSMFLVPDYDKIAAKEKEVGSDEARWAGKEKTANPKAKAFEAPCDELVITPEMRQEAYDQYKTTDDHGMHIFGLAKDQTGKEYFMVKNSWGEGGNYKGIYYASEAYVRYKTMDILINKNAIPAEIRAKLNL